MRRAPLLALLLVAGCRPAAPTGPIEVSAIGAPLDGADPALLADHGALDAPAAALAGATQQGLVRFDAGGQVVPGLAARWIVSDTGRSLIFRLPDSGAPFGAPVIVRRLRAAVAPASANPLKPLLGAISGIDAVTPQVVDVELGSPRPNILPLFAQPALAVARPARARGGGPFDLVRLNAGVATLRLQPERDADPDDASAPPAIVRLRGEAAAAAVARFAAGGTALVLGGGFADLAVARAAGLEARLRYDPAPGLFGLAFAAGQGFTADAATRRALAMAIDRDRIARALAVPGWTVTDMILPPATPEIDRPAAPDWHGLALAERRAAARSILAAQAQAGHPPARLRIALPAGPGARLLFALIADDWRAIGVDASPVDMAAPADLRLIDTVAPADTAAFYLRTFACERGVPCTPESDVALIAARVAPSLAERSAMLARADALIAATSPFIPLGSPIRWSLVAVQLDRYRDSPRAIHPLDELRTTAVR